MSDKSKENINRLLSDEKFIEWIVSPSEETNTYWSKVTQDNPGMVEDIIYLKQLIKNRQTKESPIHSIDKDEVWDAIKSQTIDYKRPAYKIRALIVSIAASIAIFIVGYTYFSSHADTPIDYNLYLKDIKTDQPSNDIELVLADNKIISIEEDTVDLVYNKEGILSVNTQDMDESSSTEMNQLSVPYGKSSTLTLSDGTRVHVNAGTRLVYPAIFDKHKRELYVDGEIYLNVAKEKDRPFIVRTSELEIRVLGTSFNVNAYSEIERQAIVLVEGSVTVKDNKLEKALKMQPNQMYSYNTTPATYTMQTVDANAHIAWIHGYMLFDKTSLHEVLLKLKRYYNLHVEYDASRISDITITGKLDLKTDVDEIFKSLKMLAPINYTIYKKEHKITIQIESINK